MMGWQQHLLIAPIVLPLLTGALMLLLSERWNNFKIRVNILSTVLLVILATYLLQAIDNGTLGEQGTAVGVYLLSNWPANLGIVLAVDRLSTLMVLVTSILSLCALVYSTVRWNKAGAHFNALFQFQIMGLNGAFLTGDLFNLFVFFEILLAASYGLLLHGSGNVRIRAGLHYVAINLAASSLFLIGVSLMYSVTGTLNMADMARTVATIQASDRMLFEAGAAVLGIAFLVKAAMWPLNFWLPTAYSAACPPVASIFSVMSKVGVYAVLRLWLLLFGPEAGASADVGSELLLYGGLATIFFGAVGVLSSQDLGRMAGFSVIISSGTLLSAISFSQVSVTAAVLLYLVVSTFACGAFFMLIELVERGRSPTAAILALSMETFGIRNADDEMDTEAHVVGVAVPAAMAFLGLSFFACALLLAGLPPLSGFVAKFSIISAMLNPSGLGVATEIGTAQWIMLGLLILSGLTVLLGMSRNGIRIFWAPQGRAVPYLSSVEALPVAALLSLCIALTIWSSPVMSFMERTAQSLHTPSEYIDSVLQKQVVPSVQRSHP
jgi:multicomponent K+:H+ antiporter subunit D